MSRVAVLIPNYNNGRFLRQCLDSVRAQQVDWLAVVGDNASTDDSMAVLGSIQDPRIRVVQRPRTIGWVANVNLLLAEVTEADYVAVLHADDWWEPAFLSTMVSRLEQAPASLIASCATRYVRDGRVIEIRGMHRMWPPTQGSTCPPADAARILSHGSFVVAPSVLARAALYRRLGGFDETLPLACDWHMWLRAASIASLEISDEPLANYRLHSGNQTGELNRANLRGLDLAGIALRMDAEWRGREPFPQAIRILRRTLTIELLAYAAQRAEAGDQDGAIQQARLARAIAPSRGQVALVAIAETTLRLGRHRGDRRIQRQLLRLGRLAWHATHRPAGASR